MTSVQHVNPAQTGEQNPGRRFRAYTAKHLDMLTQRAGLPAHTRLAVRAVATVLPFRTNAALAQSIGADKSRIIGVLDELQERGLIQRRPDPADRRVHLLSLTEAGIRMRESAREAIQRQEEERVLSVLPDADRAAFIRALRILSELPPEDMRG